MTTRPRLALLLLLPSLVGCAVGRAPATDETEATVLRVGVAPDSPPIAFRREGRIVGLEPDLADALARALGRRLEVTPMERVALVPALLGGRIDAVMSGVTVTPAREIRVAFADPYLRSGLLAAVRREDATRYASADALRRRARTVGVREGTAAETFVRQALPLASVQPYPTSEAAVAELAQGRLDAFVNDAPIVIWLVSENEGQIALVRERLNEDTLAWAFRPDDTALREAANAALGRWRQDGTLDAIVTRWLPYWSRLR